MFYANFLTSIVKSLIDMNLPFRKSNGMTRKNFVNWLNDSLKNMTNCGNQDKIFQRTMVHTNHLEICTGMQ